MIKTRSKAFKALTVLLLIFSLFSILGFFASAGEEKLREWTLSEDLYTLSDGKNEYKCVSIPQGVYADFRRQFIFENFAVREITGELYSVSSAGKYVNQYRVYTTETVLIYADEAEALSLNGFFAGEYENLRILTADGKESIIGKSLASAVSEADPGNEYSVTELKDLTRYLVVAYDSTESFYVKLGVLYKFSDGSLGYLDYEWLDESNLNAEGGLSYSSGKVFLADIDGAALADLSAAEGELSFPQYYTGYESERLFTDGEGIISAAVSKVLFWIAVVILGFCLPIAAGTVGILLPHTKKRKGKKYWYCISIVSGAYIIFAFIFVMIILV